MQSYTWKIADATLLKQMKCAANGKCFNSPTFTLCNLRCYFDFYPNGGRKSAEGSCDLYVILVMLPTNASKIVLRRKLTNQESGRFSLTKTTLTQDDASTGWPSGRLKTNEIQKFNTLTFTVDIEILGVSDQNGNDITNQYLSKNDESKTESNNNEDEQLINAAKLASIIMNIEGLNTRMNDFEKRMINMEKQMNEEQKINYDDKFDKIMKEIKWLKQSVNKISVNNIDPEQQKLKSWLQNNVKLPQYYQIFIEAGIEDLETVSLVTIGTLKDMGIDKVGHQMKILNHVSKLKHKQNEGDTAYM